MCYHGCRIYTYVQQTAAGTSSVVKTGVAAGDMKAAVEAMAAGGGLSPVETAKENGDGAAVAKGAPEEEEEAEGGGPDDDEDDSPPRELDLVGCCWWRRRRRLEWCCCWYRCVAVHDYCAAVGTGERNGSNSTGIEWISQHPAAHRVGCVIGRSTDVIPVVC